MKFTSRLGVILLIALFVGTTAHGATYAPFCPMKDRYSVEEVLSAVDGSRERGRIYSTVYQQTGMSESDIKQARNDGRLVVETCGAECSMVPGEETMSAGIHKATDTIRFWRRVQPGERVLKLVHADGSKVPLMVARCCNPDDPGDLSCVCPQPGPPVPTNGPDYDTAGNMFPAGFLQ